MTNQAKNNFLQAYNDYFMNIFKYIYRKTSNWDRAEDLAQETFLKTWQYISTDKQINNFKRFLYMVANNLIIDHYRQKNKIPISIETVSNKHILVEPLQIEETDHGIKKEALAKCLDEILKGKHKEIIKFRFIDDLSIKEISEITGMTPNNISVIIHRCVKKLKKKIFKTNDHETYVSQGYSNEDMLLNA